MNNQFLRDLLKNYNRKKMAREMGISYMTLNSYFYDSARRDTLKPSVELLWKISRYIKFDFEELCRNVYELEG